MIKLQPSFLAQIAKYRFKRGMGTIVQAFLERPYVSSSSRRVICYYNNNSISYSQIYPFIYYSKEIYEKYDCEIRYQPIRNLLNRNQPIARDIDIALVQPWFDVPEDDLAHSLAALREKNACIGISFLDSFAHNDLRLAKTLAPHISHYVKKSLFVDREKFLQPFKGDTNLTEYYSALYSLPADLSDWEVPPSILPKLRLCPNFFTAPHLIERFERLERPPNASRKIDVHARLGIKGSDWYEKMRRSCNSKLMEIRKLSLVSGGGTSFHNFINELQNSKLCLSPFGYGELCWRDVEAFMTGAVLVKPDMSHLETLPNLYEANITYLPVKWDFSDIKEVILAALDDKPKREQIAHEAFDRVHRYLEEQRFVNDIGYLFG